MLQPNDFRCHRLGIKSTDGKPRQVIARFQSRETRNSVLGAKKKLHDKQETKKIFIIEDLTPLRFKLLSMVKKHPDVEFAYTRDGKIHAVMNDDTKKTVENPDDLFKLGFTDVNYQELGLVNLD